MLKLTSAFFIASCAFSLNAQSQVSPGSLRTFENPIKVNGDFSESVYYEQDFYNILKTTQSINLFVIPVELNAGVLYNRANGWYFSEFNMSFPVEKFRQSLYNKFEVYKKDSALQRYNALYGQQAEINTDSIKTTFISDSSFSNQMNSATRIYNRSTRAGSLKEFQERRSNTFSFKDKVVRNVSNIASVVLDSASNINNSLNENSFNRSKRKNKLRNKGEELSEHLALKGLISRSEFFLSGIRELSVGKFELEADRLMYNNSTITGAHVAYIYRNWYAEALAGNIQEELFSIGQSSPFYIPSNYKDFSSAKNTISLARAGIGDKETNHWHFTILKYNYDDNDSSVYAIGRPDMGRIVGTDMQYQVEQWRIHLGYAFQTEVSSALPVESSNNSIGNSSWFLNTDYSFSKSRTQVAFETRNVGSDYYLPGSSTSMRNQRKYRTSVKQNIGNRFTVTSRWRYEDFDAVAKTDFDPHLIGADMSINGRLSKRLNGVFSCSLAKYFFKDNLQKEYNFQRYLTTNAYINYSLKMLKRPVDVSVTFSESRLQMSESINSGSVQYNGDVNTAFLLNEHFSGAVRFNTVQTIVNDIVNYQYGSGLLMTYSTKRLFFSFSCDYITNSYNSQHLVPAFSAKYIIKKWWRWEFDYRSIESLNSGYDPDIIFNNAVVQVSSIFTY